MVGLTSRERAVLLLAHAGAGGAPAADVARHGVRWGALLRAAERTRSGAFLARLADDAGLDPGPAAGPLRDEAERVAAQAALTVHAAARAQAALAAAGIRSVAVKGLAFLAHDPDHLARRHLDDVDLLVSPADVQAAAAALRAAGFEADDLLPDYRGAALDGAGEGPALHRTANFLGPGRTLVELHAALPACAGREAALAALLARAVTARRAGATLVVTGLDDTLGLVCRHVMVHHAAEADHLPRHVADVAALLRAGADPAVAAARFDGDGRGSVARSLALLEAARRGRGRAARAWSPLAAPLDRLRVRLRDYAAAAGGGPLAMLLPSRRYMAQRYRVAEGSPLLPLLYLWRPLGGAGRLLLGRAPIAAGRRAEALGRAWRLRGLSLRVLRHRLLLPLLLRRGSLPALLERLDAGAGRPGAAGDRGAAVEALVATLTRPLGLWRTTCLWRSLAGYAALRAAGAEARFLIGVRVDEAGELHAHAWLERDGRPALGAPRPEEGFRVAFAWPADPATLPRTLGARVDGIRPSDEAVLTELKDGTGVLLHLGSRHYYTLNATGVVAWKLLLDGAAADAAGLAAALAARFPGADPAAVRADVDALLAELAAERLVALPA